MKAHVAQQLIIVFSVLDRKLKPFNDGFFIMRRESNGCDLRWVIVRVSREETKRGDENKTETRGNNFNCAPSLKLFDRLTIRFASASRINLTLCSLAKLKPSATISVQKLAHLRLACGNKHERLLKFPLNLTVNHQESRDQRGFRHDLSYSRQPLLP